MTPQEREEIEKACSSLEDDLDIGHLSWMSHTEVETLLKFARQQLNLLADVQKPLKGDVTSYCKQCRAVTKWIDSAKGPVSMCAGCGLDYFR